MFNQSIQQYVVGGAVRDVLLGREPTDIDYCWTGATVEDMLAMGFSQVGASFPVFLDAFSNEHALARQERKTSPGYTGFEVTFDPTVTIEDDLRRRDLTINAMAVCMEDWHNFLYTGDISLVIDPYRGIDDLTNKTLRHTSEAFAEDPIRILRTARFCARYNFDVHLHTIALMKQILPELVTVPKERIWTEFEKGLMEEHPERMFTILEFCGALSTTGPLHPYSMWNSSILDKVCRYDDIAIRFALIALNFRDQDYDVYRIPNDCMRVSQAYHKHWKALFEYVSLAVSDRLQLLEQLKALNDPWLLDHCLRVLQCESNVGFKNTVFKIRKDIEAAKSVDCAAIALSCSTGGEIKKAIFDARIKAMEK